MNPSSPTPTHAKRPTIGKALGALAAVLVPLVLYAVVVAGGYDGISYLRGDCPYYYMTALSLLQDGDLDLMNQLGGRVPPTDLSLSKDGRIVPKHPILLPLVAMPLIAAFGPQGALAFNLLQLAALLLVLYLLAERYCGAVAAGFATIITGVGCFLPHYAWNFSPDVFSSLLVAGALLALPRGPTTDSWWRPALSGMLLGLAIYTKLPTAIFVLGVPLVLPRPWRRTMPAFLDGLALPLVGFVLLNIHLFGSPIVTSYDRIISSRNGQPVVVSQRGDFHLGNLPDGVRGQLIHPSQGLLTTAASGVLALVGLPWLARRDRGLAVYIGAMALANFLLYASYSQWPTSHYGNRFLMPAMLLGTVPLAAVIAALSFRQQPDGAVRAQAP